MKYLLDSDTIIAALSNNEKIVTALRRLEPKQLCVSVLTLCALRAAALKLSKPAAALRAIEAWTSRISVVPFTEKTAALYPALKKAALRRDKAAADADILLAAATLEHGFTLVTASAKTLKHLPKLKTVNWLS